MLTIDIVLLVLLAAAAVLGWRMGLIQQITSFVGFAISLWLAWMFCGEFSGMVSVICGTAEFTSKVICFVLITLLLTILISWGAAILTNLLDSLHIGIANRLTGMAISVVKYGIILGFIIKMFVFVGTISDSTVKRSFMAKPLTDAASMILEKIK